MPSFLNILPVRTRAVIPDYAAQWSDHLQTFDTVPDGVDYLEAGYPYSIYDLQITFDDDGNLVPAGTMYTIAGDPMLTIAGDYMEVI